MDTAEKQQIKTTQLRQEIRKPVEFLADRLVADLGDGLLSISVVGSALTDDFHSRYSDINTVLVVNQRSHQLLSIIAGYGSKMGRLKLNAPLLMTTQYIQQSLDVFGVEFLDFQLNHSVVTGHDPFADLVIEKENVRLQCERQLKSALITLRQGYIKAMSRSKIVGRLLLEAIAELVVLLRAMLWLTDNQRLPLAAPTLKAASEKFDFDANKIAPLLEAKLQHRNLPAEQIETIFEDTYQIVDQLAHRVDELATKS